MNREIKFRAWHKPTKTMQAVRKVDFELSQARAGVFIGNFAWGDGTDAFELMQFTGLKDKNGKEIYEGDIVERVYAFTKAGKEKKVIGQIIWDDYRWRFFHDYGNGHKGFTDCYSGHKAYPFEVIGNIYENPELL